jgi:hypothetical protein
MNRDEMFDKFVEFKEVIRWSPGSHSVVAGKWLRVNVSCFKFKCFNHRQYAGIP